MTLPNFLFVGADKAGSTWLFRILQAHPDCFVPAAKDIYFFDRFHGRGIRWYASFFKNAPATVSAVGELSHDYLYSDEAAARIAKTLPEVKIVVFLRHPVERTFSEYLYLVRSGLVRRKTLRQALLENPQPIEHSRYARYLPSYLERFERDRLGIFLFDHLVADPAGFASEVLGFLGLQPLQQFDYAKRVLGAARPRSALLARSAKAAATATRAAGFPTLVAAAKSSRVAQSLYVGYSERNRPTLGDSDRMWLHAELDRDLPALEALLGRPLPGWGLES